MPAALGPNQQPMVCRQAPKARFGDVPDSRLLLRVVISTTAYHKIFSIYIQCFIVSGFNSFYRSALSALALPMGYAFEMRLRLISGHLRAPCRRVDCRRIAPGQFGFSRLSVPDERSDLANGCRGSSSGYRRRRVLCVMLLLPLRRSHRFQALKHVPPASRISNAGH